MQAQSEKKIVDAMFGGTIVCPVCGDCLIPVVKGFRAEFSDRDVVGAICLKEGHELDLVNGELVSK